MWETIKGLLALFILVAMVKAWFWPKPETRVEISDQTSRPITAKDLPYPEVGIPGHVPPEGKTVYLNYQKSGPPIAINCREVGGKIECKGNK